MYVFHARYPVSYLLSSSQYFQINAERIKVVAEPLDNDSLTATDDEADTKTQPVDDFALYTAKKRSTAKTATKTTDEHTPKKGRIAEHVNSEEMNVE